MQQVGELYAGVGDKLGNSMTPEFVTPLVTYLVSEACQSTHALYSATMGRYARVVHRHE